MPDLKIKENIKWKGVSHRLELYLSDNVDGLSPITQVQAVPFADPSRIVLYKNVRGYYGLPGGTIEDGETPEEALARELREESSCEVIRSGLFGYIKDIPESRYEDAVYQLRYWAQVKILEEPINDPDGKAIGRIVLPPEEAIKKLNWGRRGEILVNVATESITNVFRRGRPGV